MGGGVTASPQIQSSYSVCSSPSTIHRRRRRSALIPRASRDLPIFSSNHLSSGFQKFSRLNLRCNSTRDSGENESRTILDAFFLGKAVAEAVNERVESAVGEFLSTIGRFQAEQQKQVQEFQEEVLEKARRAKEQAAREALEVQGLVSKSTAVYKSPAVNGVTSEGSSLETEQPTNEDPLPGIPIED
ncbi:hypothetical protein BUALT_Bualt02G0194000 [Buddleja alternifolia]|uniref:Uncharacterized protein n=1 Tax=Buddleja alternifolia TaxID=168488 RepID=A0AAV6Y3N5_9LAMI|nr:hypothetical protein BUALT_Bualt02G0194000 [Buddleja alternifolia]